MTPSPDSSTLPSRGWTRPLASSFVTRSSRATRSRKALIRAWRDLPGLRDPDRFDAWLHRLIVNACLDLARRRRRRPIEVEITPLDAPASSDLSGALADRELVDGALRRLDPGHRAVVALHYLLGMPLADVAASLGIPVGTAKSRLHYALAAMRMTVTADPDPAAQAGPRRAGRMTTEARFERQLPALLEDLYLGPSPDYRDEVLAAASSYATATRRGPSQEGGSPWLTSQTRARRRATHAVAQRSAWRSSSSRSLPSRPSPTSVRTRRRSRRRSARRRTASSRMSADGDIYTARPASPA